jgi:polysaccharide export outer membrane protein
MIKASSRISVLALSLFFCMVPSRNHFCQTERIHKGDIIEIRVYGHEELSKTLMVQSDGTVNYPLVSNIPIDGLRLDEFRDVLTAQISKYLGERPIITVRFSKTLSVSVTVLGQVSVPGEYMVAKSATVQGAITQAGGFTPRAKLDQVKLIRKKGDNKETLIVNLFEFYVEGNPDILPSLEEGDVIVVPGIPGTHDVKVIGEVKSPGSYTVFQGATLVDVLYMAGGPTENAALNKIRLVSPQKQSSREITINMDEMLKSDHNVEFPEILPGDVIYVPKGKTFWRSVVSITRDVSTIALPVVMIIYYSRRR